MATHHGPRTKDNLFLIGYRGSGKTTVAKVLAARLGWAWVDADDAVEAQAGVSIAHLFAEQGEPAFRDLEQEVVARLSAQTRQVVALGGGAVLREANRQAIRQAGPVVWLTAPAEQLAERLSADQTTATRRPSLTGAGVLEEIQQVLAERTPLYQACATLTIDTPGKTPDQIADEVITALQLS